MYWGLLADSVDDSLVQCSNDRGLYCRSSRIECVPDSHTYSGLKPEAYRCELALDGVGRPQVNPVFGREVLERQQDSSILRC
jgi:hypothetical protein